MATKKKQQDPELAKIERQRLEAARKRAEQYILSNTSKIPDDVLNGSIQRAQQWKRVASKAIESLKKHHQAVIDAADQLAVVVGQ